MTWRKKINNINTSFHDIFEFAPVGILSFDQKWIVTAVNQNFFEFGIVSSEEKESLIGSIILDNKLFPELSLNQYLKQIAAGMPFETSIKVQKKLDGSKLSIILKGSPISDDDEFKGGVLIIEDMRLSTSAGESNIIHEEYLNKVYENLCDYYFLTDRDGKVILHSTSKDNIYSNLFSKFSGNIDELFVYTESMSLRNIFETSSKTARNEQITIPLIIKGQEHFFNFQFQPVLDGNNEIKFVAVLIIDKTSEIKDKIHFENEINSLRKYKHITSSIVDAVININLDGKINYLNSTAENLFNLSHSEVIHKQIDKIFPQMEEEYLEVIKQTLYENNVWESQIRIIDDSEKSETISVKMKFIGEGENKSIVILCSKISELDRSNKTLEEEHEKYSAIISESNEIICSFDITGKIQFVNSQFSNLLGYSESEALNNNIVDLIDVEFADNNQSFVSKLVEEYNGVELPLVTNKNELLFVIPKFSAIKNSDSNETKYYNAIFTDNTQHQKAIEELSLYKSAVQSITEGILLHSNSKIVFANKSFCRIFGYNNCEEFRLTNFEELISGSDKRDVLNYYYQVMNGSIESHEMEFAGVRKDGSEILVSCNFTSFKIGDELFSQTAIRDISEQNQSRKLLEQSEDRFRSITQNISDFMWTAERKNDKLKQIFYTEAVLKVTGYSPEEFISNNNLWYKIIHPNDLADVIEKMKILYRDSTTVDGEIEYRIIKKDGSIVWVRNSLNLVRDINGTLAKIFGSVRDISMDKKAEEKLIESAENLKNLNDTKDRFISIVSHDLRTPFSSILGFTDILLSEPNMEMGKRQEYINFIQESSRNMLSLVNSLLDWTRLQTGRIQFEPERLNARFVISRAIQMLSGAAMQKGIELSSNVDHDVFVHADENLLLQVFNNFISNAIKFTNSGGKIIIESAPNIQKKQIEFFVEDNGTGIREEDIPKLFKVDTKFTNPGTAGEKGSGLGLSLCAEIIEKHGGQVSVESVLGAGTKFIFGIPISSTKILLVDDVQSERILYAKLLKSIIPNYTIVEAADGQEAFEKIKISSPALVITDHKMPMMSGLELVQQLNLSEIKYKPPVIILSRDLNPSIIAGYKSIGVDYIFSKPVDLNTFKFAVEKSLRKAIYS